MGLKVNFVAADKRIWSGDADMVIAPSIDGEIGILAGHEPIMSWLNPGKVKVSSHDENSNTHVTSVNITGGFLSVFADEVNIVADEAVISD